MRSFIIPFAIALASFAHVAAQPAVSVSPASVEFGRIGPVRVDTTITIANRGTAQLTIVKAVPSCGCTAGKLERTEIAPGESTTLSLTVDARHKNGDVRTSMTIVSNDPSSPHVVVPLHSIVVRDVEMPEFLGPVPDAKVGIAQTMALAVKNLSATPLHLHSPRVVAADGVEVSLGKIDVVVEPGESWTAPIGVTPTKAGAGSATVELATSSSVQPSVSVGLYTNATGDGLGMGAPGR